jgi:hypothetical protein
MIESGTSVGHYQILEPLGEGGMGMSFVTIHIEKAVFEVVDPRDVYYLENDSRDD